MLAPITHKKATSKIHSALSIPVSHDSFYAKPSAKDQFADWLSGELESLEEEFAAFHTPEGFKTAIGR